MKIEDYIEIINEKRPHIKPNSARTYAISLRSIAPKDATSMKWLSNVDYVLKQLQRYKETTRKNILNAVIVASNGVAAEKFVTERDRYNDLYAQHTKAHKKTASQQKNWVEWPAFQAMVRDMAQDVSDMKGGRAWSAPELMRYQDYVLALLYSHYPLRNDFGDVKILSKMGFKRLSGADKSQQNYLVKTGNQMFLVLNEYKTSKKYGEKRIDMDAAVLPALRKLLKHNTSGHLFVDPGDAQKPLGSNGISKALARIGMRRLQKRLGSSLLRHSYLSHKYADLTAEKQKDADLMMHSVGMQDGYIKT